MKKLAAFLLSAPFLFSLAGCMFQPMYGSTGVGGSEGFGPQLASVEIGQVGGRTGVELRNELIFQLTGGGVETKSGAYKLDVALQENETQSQIEQVSGRPTAGLIYIAANYVLTDTKTGKHVFESRTFARTSIDEGIQRYANLRATRSAEDDAVKMLSINIRNGLAAYFAQKAQGNVQQPDTAPVQAPPWEAPRGPRGMKPPPAATK